MQQPIDPSLVHQPKLTRGEPIEPVSKKKSLKNNYEL